MDKNPLLDVVKTYIANEELSIGYALSKSTRNQWIIDSVRDELKAINNDYRIIDNDDLDAKRIFRNKSIDIFETDNFKKYLKNKSDINSLHYNKLLKSCVISADTIEDFFMANRVSNPKTIDFFNAFCRTQEREYGKTLLSSIVRSNKKSTNPSVKPSKLYINGATIINAEFIATVKSGKEFTMSEFYGAKQNNNCQWYGIINDFDVLRSGYDLLKKTVLDSFIEEKDGKVSAIVYGTGGSGKSTILRRLAIDFHAESFVVVWLDKGETDEFAEKGLTIIKNEIERNVDRKFLIIIEDWDGMFNDITGAKLGNKILNQTYSINNTRIIIGDRNNNSSYKKYRNNDFELLVSSKDNQEIIEKIIEKNPNWELDTKKLYGKTKNYQPSLFLLLFIISRFNQEKNNKNIFGTFEAQQVFQNIIESDLKFIYNRYPGLAKALYYWGCLYSNNKVFISYETFLNIADYYNDTGKNEISNWFCRWEAKDDDVLDRLKIYINKTSFNRNKNYLNFIFFNHDILVNSGLGKLDLEEFEKFGDRIKFQLLEIIIDTGDDYSTSQFLSSMLTREKQIFKNQEEELFFIEKLIKNNNKEDYHLYALTQLKLDDETFIKFAKLIWEKKIDCPTFWDSYFNRFKSTKIIYPLVNEILNIDYYHNYDPAFVKLIMTLTRNTKNKKKFISDVISKGNHKIIDSQILVEAFDFAVHQDKLNFIEGVLEDKDWIESCHTFECFNPIESDKVELFFKCVEYFDPIKAKEMRDSYNFLVLLFQSAFD
ncbi:MAG: ATP-binding protein [Flavobacteriales bacterium]|nr:ATP-binding protein [Flavobacteriales bacterium]